MKNMMVKLNQKLTYMLAGLLYGLMLMTPAVAEDIEIYRTGGGGGGANILFLLDTSGSMGSYTFNREPYDPDQTYTEGHTCFDEQSVYIYTQHSASFVRTSGEKTWAEKMCDGWSHSRAGKVIKFAEDDFVCDAGKSLLQDNGFYSTIYAIYNRAEERWDDVPRNTDIHRFNAKTDLDAYLECQDDAGIHGKTADSDSWASDAGTSGWSNQQANEIDWKDEGVPYIVFTGHYINYIISEGRPENLEKRNGNAVSRIEITKEILNNLFDTSSNLNIGLMRFSSRIEGGMVVTEVANIGPIPDDIENLESGSQRDKLRTELNKMQVNGSSPLEESYYEAVMYFKGGEVDYGDRSTSTVREGGSHKLYKSVAASRVGGTMSSGQYQSPIKNECQKNYIVLLTDGERDFSDDSLNDSQRDKIGSDVTGCGVGLFRSCLDKIAHSIGENDQMPDIDGDQVISTFTIGFDDYYPLLNRTAQASMAATGSGERYFAENTETLAASLTSIRDNILDVEDDIVFSAPAVSINSFNRSTHLDHLYFNLFQPKKSPRWAGNLKKYKLKFLKDVDDVDGDQNSTEFLPFIVDARDNVAVEFGEDEFKDDSRSFWTDVDADGEHITKGGTANEFALDRKVYTYTGDYTNNNGVFKPTAPDLTLTSNAVSKDNEAITVAMLGFDGGAEIQPGILRRDSVLDWAAGIDILDINEDDNTDDARLDMGDPLHSAPALVQYGGSANAPDLVIFSATNDGYLHAFDADDGSEIFSFIPQELLKNLNTVMNVANGAKAYGLDGDVVAWVNDKPDEDGVKDGIINGSDHVYLYIGMRRGGKNIYSVDVTDRNNPKLRWVIKGGIEGSAYAELGQTWSSINIAKIKDGTSEKTVLIFAGGYDTAQDNAVVRTPDNMGRAVYIADAKTGERLWSAGQGGNLPLVQMQYSIPARIAQLDMSGDGFIDRLYVSDVGGQIFRFDIDNTNDSPLAASITGGRIANLAADNSAIDARRFYYPPDISLLAKRGQPAYLAIGIASGFRAHPLNTTIQDRIYLLKDTDVYRKPASYTTLAESDLYDASENLIGGNGSESQNNQAKIDMADKKGWYIKLNNGEGEFDNDAFGGEKGLSEVLFIENMLVVTTFLPDDDTHDQEPDSCVYESDVGDGNVYFLDVFDASAAFPHDGDDREDRIRELDADGIPPPIRTIYTSGDNAVPTVCIGLNCQAAGFAQGLRKTHWHEVER